MAAAPTFPSRAFVQRFANDRLPPENALVVAELAARKIPCVMRTTEEFNRNLDEITRNDLIVGDFDWTRAALKRLGVPFPVAVDYPDCLCHLLHRRIWETSLGEVQQLLLNGAAPMFIKPATDTKAFSGLVASVDWLAYLGEQFPASFRVLCSDLVTIVSEYRVYIVNGGIRSVCHYKGEKNGDGEIDMKVVEGAVASLAANVKLAGCAIDFAVMKKDKNEIVTALMEVNDGFSLGAYEGLSGKDYTDLLIARWGQLVTAAAAEKRHV